MDQADESDESLMLRVKRDERPPLSLLLRRYANPLLTFILRTNGDRHRSEELFQDVFLKVWTARRTYEYPRPFRCWLFGIAANHCVAEYRRRNPFTRSLQAPLDLATATTVDPSPMEAAIAMETAELVEEAVLQLPDQQRAVVVMRIWNGLSYEEIATALGRTESTVRSNMCHGLSSMRKYLEPWMR